MPNLLQKSGAQSAKPAHFGVLWHNNFYLGIVTQRNPLHSFLQHIEEEFYGNQPCQIDGLNTEVSTALTIVRRPGHSVYNTSTIPQAINRYYENRVSIFNASQTSTTESIQVLADTASTIRDVTGPSTNSVVFTKSSGAGSTFFQSVGNELFFSDGPEQKKLITPNLIWAANQTFNTGNQVLDTNGNLQIVQGTGTASISDIAVVSSTLGVVGGPTLYFLQVTFASDVFWTQGTPVSFSGATTYTTINNQTQTVVVNPTYLTPAPTVAYFTTSAAATYGPTVDTGIATSTNSTGSGLSGSTVTWSASLGGLTTDNQLTWQNFGVPLYDWATDGPELAPTITPVTGNRYWSPNTTLPLYYSIMTAGGQVQYVLSAGTTGQTLPVWNTTVPSVTTPYPTATIDGTVQWSNVGTPGSWAPSTTFYGCIIDPNNNLQVTIGNTTGSYPPVSWNTTIGGYTPDGVSGWACLGPASVISFGTIYYAYSWVSTDGSVTTSSPFAVQNYGTFVLGPANNAIAILSGSFPSDPQITAAWVWRSVQNGSSAALFFDSAIPNPTPGTASNWTFTDVIPDTFLNELIEAPIADQNNPPPVGLTALAYHLNRVWGAVGNIVFNSQTSGIVGNPYTAWDPQSFFQFPSTVVRLWPTSNGLFVFTVSDVYIIQGLGDSSSSFFSTPLLGGGLGLGNYDAFVVNGAIAYLYTTDNQVCSIDPSSGFSEVGFPVGDQFGPNNGQGTFTPSTAFLTWHFDGSQEKALYVSDRASRWWRMMSTPTPETGMTWSPIAVNSQGFSAVQSVETSPGVHTLLLGPPSSGQILKRDSSVYSDNGLSYNAYSVIGSLVLAQPGQLAYAKSVTTDSMAIGTPLTLQVQLDEISYITGLATVAIQVAGSGYAIGDLAYVGLSGNQRAQVKVTSISGSGPTGPVTGLSIAYPGKNYPGLSSNIPTVAITGSGTGLRVNITTGGMFENLTLSVPDPTQLTASQTLNAQRFYLSQTQQPAVCRHMQIAVEFGTDVVKNELLSLTVYGSFEQED